MTSYRFLAALVLLGLSGCPGTDPPPETDGGPTPRDAPLAPCTVDVEPEAALAEPPRHTPRWAFEPWISKDIDDRAGTLAFVEGFRSRDIPVGVVVLDSPWDTNYTTFTPNPSRYPDFPGLVETMHGMDVRVVLWTTQMVNSRSYDLETGGDEYDGPAITYTEARSCGFLAANDQLFTWWKGMGTGVDFFDPRARAWFHEYQNTVLDAGIDGWKLDFGESYMEAVDPLMTDAGEVSLQAYSEAYYRDFLAYGLLRRGPEFVTMVRGWDRSYDRETRFFARPEHAPVVWAGDNRRDWVGLEDALETMLRSAQAGYVVVGSDIGGYLDRDDLSLGTVVPFDGEVFDRWVAVGAMNAFMQLHGRANLAPWTVPERVDETIANYRYWAHLHHAMVPFWYSLAEEMHARPVGTASTMTPIGATPEDWVGDYRYTIGDAFLVAPLLEAGGRRDVPLPAGARWYDWWDAAGDAIDGGTTLADYDSTDRIHIPLFVREGAIVPTDVATDVNGLGSEASEGFLTVLGWPGAAASTFVLHEEDDSTTTIGLVPGTPGGTDVTFAPARASVILRLRVEAAPTAVTADTAALTSVADAAALETATSGYLYDATSNWLWVKTTDAVGTVAIR